MKKVIGLVFLASFLATPALAGETYVRNSWTNSNSHTMTDLNLKSITNSSRHEGYASWAKKSYYEGGNPQQHSTSGGGKKKDKKDYVKGYSEHHSGSVLFGKFGETSTSYVNGTIKTRSHDHTRSHETSGGVR